MAKNRKRKVIKSAVSGWFVKKETAKARPKTTFVQTVRVRQRRAGRR